MDLALTLTTVGITVVFAALIILAFLISLFSKVINFKNKNVDNTKKGDVLTNTIDSASDSSIENSSVLNDDQELVAVITAAILASVKQKSPDFNIRVKSFRRINDSSPAWNVAGKFALLDNKIK